MSASENSQNMMKDNAWHGQRTTEQQRPSYNVIKDKHAQTEHRGKRMVMIKTLTGAQHSVGGRGEWEDNSVDLVGMAEDVVVLFAKVRRHVCSNGASEQRSNLGGWLRVRQREDRKILWGALLWGRCQTTDDIGSHRILERAMRHSTSTT